MPFVNASSNAAASAATTLIPAALSRGRVRVACAEFTCNSDAQGTYNVPIRLPIGARVLTMFLNASATMGGTATIAIGITGTIGKYRAAAIYTATDTFTFHSLNAATMAQLTAEEQIIMTVAAAALPASGRLLVGFLYVFD
jgi:hypothetical protein